MTLRIGTRHYDLDHLCWSMTRTMCMDIQQMAVTLTNTSIAIVTNMKQQQQQPSSPCPLQQMMWFLLFQHRLSPHHAVSPSGNLHTQYQPPPESAAHGIGKPRHWSKPAEPTTFTLTLTHSHLHTHCLH